LDPSKRLGAVDDADAIMIHKFFGTIDFSKIEAKLIKPPYEPEKKELKFFDSELTK